MTKIIARHKWIAGTTITESDVNDEITRFTATIRGYRNWRIFQGKVDNHTVEAIIARVKQIRDRIDAGDEDVFYEIVGIDH